MISPTGYLEKGVDTFSASLVTPRSEYILEDNSKLEIITDSDDLEQPTRIANYDYSMQYLAIIYEGKQYMVAIPTDDIEDLNHQERTEIVVDAQKEGLIEEKEEVEENLDDNDDALDLLSYIYTLDQASSSTDSFIEGEEARNSIDETVSSVQKSNGELEESSNSHSFFEYFSRRFLA